ncbi:hypothetical protein ACHAWF_004189 [Thalassiosira exigua]
MTAAAALRRLPRVLAARPPPSLAREGGGGGAVRARGTSPRRASTLATRRDVAPDGLRAGADGGRASRGGASSRARGGTFRGRTSGAARGGSRGGTAGALDGGGDAVLGLPRLALGRSGSGDDRCVRRRIRDRRGIFGFASGGGDDDVDEKIASLVASGDLTRAREALDRAVDDAASRDDPDGLPALASFASLLTAYVAEQERLLSELRSSSSDGGPDLGTDGGSDGAAAAAVEAMSLAERAHDLLVRAEDLSGVSDAHSSMRLAGKIETDLRDARVRPNSEQYDAVVAAFANASVAAREAKYTSHLIKNAPYIARRWLERTEKLALDPESGVAPTADTYYRAMEACASSGGGLGAPDKHRSQAAALAESVFDKLRSNRGVRPTAREYRLMMRTWCECGRKEGAYHALMMWDDMQDLFRGGDESMEPSLGDGKAVLEAFTTARSKPAARRASQLLRRMERFHSAKQTSVRPDLDCYRHVLIAMSHSQLPEVGDDVPMLFGAMERGGLFPDTQCFDAAIVTLANCAAHSTGENAVRYSKAAENMLELMEREARRSSAVKPSAVSYNHVIRALGSRGSKRAAEKAEVLLTKMEQEYEGGEESMRPSRESYMWVLRAYGKSGAESNFSLADDVLRRMESRCSEGNEEACPDVHSFHALIRACAHASETSASSEGHKEALLLAISAVQRMKRSGNDPTPRTYRLLLKCAASLFPPGAERERALRSIFQGCAGDGLLDRRVLDEFRSAASTELYHDVVTTNATTINGVKALPGEWTRALGYGTRIGAWKRNLILSVSGGGVASVAYHEHRMRRRRAKKNQKLLRGGRTPRSY